MQASELITRALRLINQPGRGATLSAADQSNALEALQEILDSEAVSKQFVPGIRRHFFPMVQGKAIYSYGASPQMDLRSDNFDDDPPPIHIEGAYIRSGSSITDSEVVDEYRYENAASWILGGAGAAITNNQLVIEQVIDTASQAFNAGNGAALVDGTTYTIRINAEILNGTFEVQLRDGAIAFETYTIDASGRYEFDFVWPTTVAPDVVVATLLATDDMRINSLSIIERGKARLALPDARGSDYIITVIDQTHYNRRFTKGTGGRPYQILYSRNYGYGEIRFDNSAISGDILVLDVLVNRVQVNRPEDELRVNPEAIRWLRYALADNVAGEYGKSLNMRQLTNLREAWSRLASGNRRVNRLGVDRALRHRPTFDINRGDP